MVLCGFLWESMVPFLRNVKNPFRRSWGLFVDCGMIPGALEGILMCQGSLASATKEKG